MHCSIYFCFHLFLYTTNCIDRIAKIKFFCDDFMFCFPTTIASFCQKFNKNKRVSTQWLILIHHLKQTRLNFIQKTILSRNSWNVTIFHHHFEVKTWILFNIVTFHEFLNNVVFCIKFNVVCLRWYIKINNCVLTLLFFVEFLAKWCYCCRKTKHKIVTKKLCNSINAIGGLQKQMKKKNKLSHAWCVEIFHSPKMGWLCSIYNMCGRVCVIFFFFYCPWYY